MRAIRAGHVMKTVIDNLSGTRRDSFWDFTSFNFSYDFNQREYKETMLGGQRMFLQPSFKDEK